LLGSTSAQSNNGDHEQAKKGVQHFSIHSYLLLLFGFIGEIHILDQSEVHLLLRKILFKETTYIGLSVI
jgi:hypothetical protein